MPGKSITTISPALYRTAQQSLNQYVAKELSCKDYEVIDTIPIHHTNNLAMDNSGQILDGIIVERWLINYCSYAIELGLEFSADGHGGSYVAIVPLPDENTSQEKTLRR